MKPLGEVEVLAVHERAMRASGGAGQPLRNRDGLQSALARGPMLGRYAQTDAIDECAAVSYAIVQSRPFVDGNKRTAWAVLRYGLLLSGYRLVVQDEEAVPIMIDCATGDLSDVDYGSWIRRHVDSGK